MPQLSLYLDDSTMEGLRKDAAREGKTLSKFVTSVLKDHAENNHWPHGFFDLYGACDDETFVEPPEVPWGPGDAIPALDFE